ncbi:MAG: hypothetical protein A3E78_06475 [Alphaproteobacteria bacterium RIFCSPHIGHO2_12_FULL_63_12]|nr:MAG: hypothetical protein A3E78_06475 [Alphaproteobacteria bacterium RIFCSPHIGHO2_12_FULL_63_12]
MKNKSFWSAIAIASMLSASPAAFAADAGLNDLQIAHIAYTAGQIDIGYAEIALKKTHDKDVRAFADTMLRDHAKVNDAALALLKKLNVAPEDNATSQSLETAAAAKRAELSALKGAAFDKAYVANEVAYHQLVNTTLDQTLIPETKNAELKALLTSALGIFTEHERHAETLEAEVK